MKSDNLFEIDVHGIVSEKRYKAKNELQYIFRQWDKVFEGIPIKIIITPNFDQTVNSILKEKLKVKHQYFSTRNQVVAIGKTITYPTKNGIGFILVFNSILFRNWGDEQALDRFMFFFHEAIHIIDILRLFRYLGEELFFSEPEKTNDIMFGLAYRLWMEYNAERSIVEKIEKMVKSYYPEAYITYKSHEGHIESFKELLLTLPKYLNKEITDFKNKKTNLYGLWQRANSRILELITVASYTTAHSDALNKKHEQIEELKKDEQYSLFFQRWEIINKKLQLLYESIDKFDNNILQDISYELLSIFKIFGFTLSDVENGIYIGVQ